MGKSSFKVSDARNPDRRIGVVATSVDDLLDKACNKLKVMRRGARVCETDGTNVEDDDYLLSLPARSILIVVQRDVDWSPDTGSKREKVSKGYTL